MGVEKILAFLIPTVEKEVQEVADEYDTVVDKTKNIQDYFNRKIKKIRTKINETQCMIIDINSNKFTSLAKGSSYELYNYTKGDQSLFHKSGSEEIIELLHIADDMVRSILMKSISSYLDVLNDPNNLYNKLDNLSSMNDKHEKTIDNLNKNIRHDIELGGGVEYVSMEYALDQREKFNEAVRKYYQILNVINEYLNQVELKLKELNVKTKVPLKPILKDLDDNIKEVINFMTRIKFLIKRSSYQIYNDI